MTITSDATEYDVEALLGLAREKSTQSRESLVNALSDLFGEDDTELSPRERTSMQAILRRLVESTEREVRRAVAQRFADSNIIPIEAAFELASDDIEVAYPILRHSTVLRDLELIEIIRNRTFEHQLAISQRESLSAEVTGALVETGRQKVILNLLRNTGAKFQRHTLERLVEDSQTVEDLREPLVYRSELSEDLGKRMFVWVSAALRQHIISRYEIDEDEADRLLADSHSGSLIPTFEPNANTSAKEVAEILEESGSITPDILFNSLQSGEIKLFSAMLREATGLRPMLSDRIIFEPGGEGLAIVFKAMNCSSEMFEKIFVATRRARSIAEGTIRREKMKLRRFYGSITPDAADRVMANWRLDEDYLTAIREIEL